VHGFLSLVALLRFRADGDVVEFASTLKGAGQPLVAKAQTMTPAATLKKARSVVPPPLSDQVG